MTARVHAFCDDALGNLDATGIAERIRRGDISRAEAVAASIERVQRVDPELAAIRTADFDRALRQASRPHGPNGPFSGVPTVVKENVAAEGLPRLLGSAAIDPAPLRRDLAPAAQWRAQGFVILGTSTMPELALTASTEFADGRPPTKNPWDTEFTASGSSGGSAALVASGATPIAHGNDGGGSIRIPAAVNGLVGLKPSRGRLLDQPGVRALPINIMSEGALARSVRDAAAHLAAAERYRRNPALPPVGHVRGPGGPLRIGVLTETITPAGVAPELAAATHEVATLLEHSGHRAEAVTTAQLGITEQFIADFLLYWHFVGGAALVATALDSPTRFHPRKLDPVTKQFARRGARSPRRVLAAIRRLRSVKRMYEAIFREHDVVLSPTLAQHTPRLGHLDPNLPFDQFLARTIDFAGFTPLNNVSGGPAISIPAGLDSNGLPIGVHFSAPIGAEARLLQIAYEVEAARPFPKICSRAPERTN
ncbi:MAG: amidase [Segniliparus sp.]|uniref:amidase n=1 Tax=Segniliparus sp. TaxID=2804064 RepID=UPI003F395A05